MNGSGLGRARRHVTPHPQRPRRWRLAVYLLITGAGALVLDPVLKSLIGRLRPVVAHPIAHGTGDSFPSGHSPRAAR